MAKRKDRKLALLAGALGCLLVLVVVVVFWSDLRASYRIWSQFEGIGVNAQGYQEFKHRETGIVFVRLPGGTFLMGSPEEEEGAMEREWPQHEAELDSFLIAKFEVTQAEWERVMANNPSEFKANDHPVEHVALAECEKFCERSNLSLPTEAQWEYACRAGTPGPFSGTGELDDMGWWFESGYTELHHREVGKKLPNAFGLHDMHGNVSELCRDTFDENFYKRSESRGKNPLCVGPAAERVKRGGGWHWKPFACRSAMRQFWDPENRRNDSGFRPAFNPWE